MVFEKFAEMNNKYDVNNFSKLIDTFNLEKEVQLHQDEIDDQVKYMRMNHYAEMGQTIFEPILPFMSEDNEYVKDCVGQAYYEVAKFKHQRFDIDNLNDRLLVPPPHRLAQHVYKDEVINYVLDKSFINLPLKIDHVEALQQLFMKSELRDSFLKFLETDYKAYELNHLEQQMVERRSLKVALPPTIYQNVTGTFHMFLIALTKELFGPLSKLGMNAEADPQLKMCTN